MQLRQQHILATLPLALLALAATPLAAQVNSSNLNKPGAATNIANPLVEKAAPDCYTLMLVMIAFASNQGLFAKPRL